jgi:hypothetical protein
MQLPEFDCFEPNGCRTLAKIKVYHGLSVTEFRWPEEVIKLMFRLSANFAFDPVSQSQK